MKRWSETILDGFDEKLSASLALRMDGYILQHWMQAWISACDILIHSAPPHLRRESVLRVRKATQRVLENATISTKTSDEINETLQCVLSGDRQNKKGKCTGSDELLSVVVETLSMTGHFLHQMNISSANMHKDLSLYGIRNSLLLWINILGEKSERDYRSTHFYSFTTVGKALELSVKIRGKNLFRFLQCQLQPVHYLMNRLHWVCLAVLRS